MAKQNEIDQIQTEVSEKSIDAPISTRQLLELLAKMNSESSKTLAEAIVAAQKPYIDPKVEQNEEMFRAQNRAQMEAERLAKYNEQHNCPHIAGCNPLSELRDPAGRTSILWHRSDSTEWLGICTYCIRVFRDTDPDYNVWRSKPSFNRPSMAGERNFLDPKAARERARS